MVQLLQSLRRVKLESLVTKLPLPILAESRRRKLQRVLSLPQLQLELLGFPIWQMRKAALTGFEGDSLSFGVDRWCRQAEVLGFQVDCSSSVLG
jgi:hypothetical protein